VTTHMANRRSSRASTSRTLPGGLRRGQRLSGDPEHDRQHPVGHRLRTVHARRRGSRGPERAASGGPLHFTLTGAPPRRPRSQSQPSNSGWRRRRPPVQGDRDRWPPRPLRRRPAIDSAVCAERSCPRPGARRVRAARHRLRVLDSGEDRRRLQIDTLATLTLTRPRRAAHAEIPAGATTAAPSAAALGSSRGPDAICSGPLRKRRMPSKAQPSPPASLATSSRQTLAQAATLMRRTSPRRRAEKRGGSRPSRGPAATPPRSNTSCPFLLPGAAGLIGFADDVAAAARQAEWKRSASTFQASFTSSTGSPHVFRPEGMR